MTPASFVAFQFCAKRESVTVTPSDAFAYANSIPAAATEVQSTGPSPWNTSSPFTVVMDLLPVYYVPNLLRWYYKSSNYDQLIWFLSRKCDRARQAAATSRSNDRSPR